MSSSGVSHFEDKAGVVSCPTTWGSWHQTAHEVNVLIDTEAGTRGKEVDIIIKPSSLTCSVRGKELFKVGIVENETKLPDSMNSMFC